MAINQAYFGNLKERAEALPKEEELPPVEGLEPSALDKIAIPIIESINSVTENVNSAIGGIMDSICPQLKLLEKLTELPDPSEIIEYIKSLVEVFTAQFQALIDIQLALIPEFAELQAMISEKVDAFLALFANDAPGYPLPPLTPLMTSVSCPD